MKRIYRRASYLVWLRSYSTKHTKKVRAFVKRKLHGQCIHPYCHHRPVCPVWER